MSITPDVENYMQKNQSWIDKINSSQRAKSYSLNVLFILGMLLINPFVLGENYYQDGMQNYFKASLIGSVVLTTLNIYALFNNNALDNIDFGMLNSESDLNESLRTKRVKSILLISVGVLVSLVILTVFLAIYLSTPIFNH